VGVVGEVEIEEDDVRLEAFALKPGGEGARGDLDLVLGLLGEDFCSASVTSFSSSTMSTRVEPEVIPSRGMPWSCMNLMSCCLGIRRSLEPGIL